MKKLYIFFLAVLLSSNVFAQILPCTASYAADPVPGSYTLFFSPTNPNNTIQWSFGDGTGGVGSMVSHMYPVGGGYNACATEIDSATGTVICQSCVVVISNGIGLACNISYSQVVPGNDSWLTFIGNTNQAMVNSIWDFGDGVTTTGALAVNHQYTTPGTYTACFTAMTSTDTCVSCTTVSVTNNPAGGCSITYMMTPGMINSIDFTFLSQNSNGLVEWDFGDSSGVMGSGYTTNHLFLQPGVYTVCASEYDSLGVLLCQSCQTVSVFFNPSCSFTYASILGVPANTFDFYAGISSTSIAVWNFGDGSPVDSGINVSHNFPSNGTYTVCLTEIDILTQTVVCTSCQTIVLGVQPCDAQFTVVPFGLDAYFIDFSAGYTANTTYTWDFGDGTGSNLRFPMHTYSTPGTYNACLAIDNGVCQDTMCTTLSVDTTFIGPLMCQAYFVFTQLSPFQLAVVNLSSGQNLQFAWDFGDGGTSTAAYPIHNYSTFGTYNICLTVTGGGCTSTYCDTLSVDSSGMIVYRSMNAGFTINVLAPNQLNSVKELGKDLSAHIFPNPATDRLLVNGSNDFGKKLVYTIRSVTGSVVDQADFNSANSEINIEGLTIGIYFLELRNEKNEISFARFIKQ
jgi:PKD repeat protein